MSNLFKRFLLENSMNFEIMSREEKNEWQDRFDFSESKKNIIAMAGRAHDFDSLDTPLHGPAQPDVEGGTGTKTHTSDRSMDRMNDKKKDARY
jgi:hypothetical protein